MLSGFCSLSWASSIPLWGSSLELLQEVRAELGCTERLATLALLCPPPSVPLPACTSFHTLTACHSPPPKP